MNGFSWRECSKLLLVVGEKENVCTLLLSNVISFRISLFSAVNLLTTRWTEYEIVNAETLSVADHLQIHSSPCFTNPCFRNPVHALQYAVLASYVSLALLISIKNSSMAVNFTWHCGLYKPPLSVPVCDRVGWWSLYFYFKGEHLKEHSRTH